MGEHKDLTKKLSKSLKVVVGHSENKLESNDRKLITCYLQTHQHITSTRITSTQTVEMSENTLHFKEFVSCVDVVFVAV